MPCYRGSNLSECSGILIHSGGKGKGYKTPRSLGCLLIRTGDLLSKLYEHMSEVGTLYIIRNLNLNVIRRSGVKY